MWKTALASGFARYEGRSSALLGRQGERPPRCGRSRVGPAKMATRRPWTPVERPVGAREHLAIDDGAAVVQQTQDVSRLAILSSPVSAGRSYLWPGGRDVDGMASREDV